jgi:predicted dehydrogenase
MNQPVGSPAEFNRREFLRGGSFATAMALLGGVELIAQPETEKAAGEKPAGQKVGCAVIGLGAWGREIINALLRLPQAELAAICDIYPASLKRAASLVPSAKPTEDYKTVLSDKDVTAVVVATPTHLHKDIVLTALKAGKHVYCEAPLAHTVEDAREIALAAQAAFKQVFQPGLQLRSANQRIYVQRNIRSGELGRFALVRAQWHKKQSWRSASPNLEREKALNWRLEKETSPGLAGEIGIHQIDQVSWFLNRRPLSISGFGAITNWNDGRDVPDTIQAVLEFPDGVRLVYHCTLASSFDGEYEVYYGSNAAVVMRESRAWMFKEVDSPLGGWEVYAKKEVFVPNNETGIVIAADASKQTTHLEKPGEAPPQKTPLQQALESFVGNATEFPAEVAAYIDAYGPIDDRATFEKHMSENYKPRPAATFMDGYVATVIALKSNEAVIKREKVVFKKEWFELA